MLRELEWKHSVRFHMNIWPKNENEYINSYTWCEWILSVNNEWICNKIHMYLKKNMKCMLNASHTWGKQMKWKMNYIWNVGWNGKSHVECPYKMQSKKYTCEIKWINNNRKLYVSMSHVFEI